MDINILNNFIAKTDGQSIKIHVIAVLNILKQLKIIYDIDEETYRQLVEACEIHDIGKAHYEFQESPGSKNRKVRHELLSASYLNLTYYQRIAILLHHKDIKHLNRHLLKAELNYDEYRHDLERILDIQTVHVLHIIDRLNRSTLCEELKDKMLIQLKGYLQLCDHLASAGINEIEGGFDANETYSYAKLSSIQRKVKKLKGRRDIIIIAMTGLGKTSTAMYWSDLVQNEHKSKRIYYILPFTASINAKYHEFSELGISTAMLHGKAEYFLNKEMEDADECKSKYQMFKKSVRQVTVCTIYQLFKAIFSCKNFEMLLCQMKNSIFIIDEIHCFDVKQLALILTTLKYLKENYGIHICVMSASIPSCLLSLVREELNIDTVINADKEDLIERHHINYYDSYLINSLDKIEQDLEQGKQVLVCCNSVALSQEIYDIFCGKYKVKLIHGKFNTRDREQAEKDLAGQHLLIGTQAIEVSLNMSYDTIYTEIAPFDALLQRFGRVNRKGEKVDEQGNKILCEVHIFKDSSNIYNDDVMNNTKAVIEQIINNDNGVIYEDKVNDYLDKVYLDFDREEYFKTKEQLLNVMDNMIVGDYTKSSEMMENMGVQVLPASLLDEFENHMENRNYLEANSLLTNVTERQYYYIRKKNKIRMNNKYGIHIIDLKYTSDRGLEFGVHVGD